MSHDQEVETPTSHVSQAQFESTSTLSGTNLELSQASSRPTNLKTPPPDKRQRRQMHARSQSHTKITTRLSTSGLNAKPNLSRSKSTDGIIRAARPGVKRNRLYTKLQGFAPLTKTTLNGSAKGIHPLKRNDLSGSLKGLAPLRKTTLNLLALGKTSLDQLIRQSKSATSLKSITVGLKTSQKRGRAILKLNEEEDGFEDLDQDSEPENVRAVSNEHLQKHFQPEEVYDFKEPYQGTFKNPSKVPYSKAEDFNKEPLFTESSTDDLMSKNLYGGSMLLSQSTGLTRKIPNTDMAIDLATSQKSERSEQSEMSDKVGSGISFQARLHGERPEEPVKPPSYQPNQTIFNNLQRTNLHFLSNQKQQRSQNQVPVLQQVANSGANSKDFSSYLSNGTNIETRTQQRLWLQRENLLMDVPTTDASRISNFSNLSLNNLMFSHNYSTTNVRDLSATVQGVLGQPGSSPVSENGTPQENQSVTNLLYLIQSGHQNSIQSRTEFERLNREYVNVRRHLNPVAKALNRVRSYMAGPLELPKKSKNSSSALSQNANSFEDFVPASDRREEESQMLIGKLWQDALLLSSSSSASMQLYQQEQQQHHQQQQQQQQQQMRQYRGMGATPTRSMPPTTRAVKLAQAAANSPAQARQPSVGSPRGR